ncbi:DUF2188 domain-containing protein [Bacteroidales bacterium OttesenSCG-928-A17]|nr:DUF2188 domain-containing protein [Bacteroidales bacterium OttesenSCG-928-A17]
MRTVYHVTKTETGWKGQVINTSTPVVTGTTKKEVMEKTIELAKKQKLAQVVIHKADGKIQEERTYPRSSDPRGNG